MKCHLQRRHHERCTSESFAVEIGAFGQSCPELSKVLNSTRSVGSMWGIGHRLQDEPSTPPKAACTTLSGNIYFFLSTRSVGSMWGIGHRLQDEPSTRPKAACTTLSGNILFFPSTPSGFARCPSLPIARASFGGGGFSLSQ